MTIDTTYLPAALTDAANAPSRLSHYAVALEERGDFVCRCCDYADAMLSFFKPGVPLPVAADARVLSFSKTLVQSSALRLHFADYSFFGFLYPRESLHISLREKGIVDKLFDSVAEELEHGIDEFTNTLLAEKINLLLTNCRRFYQRQMILCENYCEMHVAKAEKIVDQFYREGRGCDMPDAQRCADGIGVSEAYMHSVIRFVTGKTFREFAQLRQLRMAKSLLTATDRQIADISRSLGFPSEACFNEFFRIVAGMTAEEFRQTRC